MCKWNCVVVARCGVCAVVCTTRVHLNRTWHTHTHCKRCKSGKDTRAQMHTAHWQVAALVAVGRWQWIYLCYFHFIYIFRFLSFLRNFSIYAVRNVHRFGWLRAQFIPMWKLQKARKTRMQVAFGMAWSPTHRNNVDDEQKKTKKIKWNAISQPYTVVIRPFGPFCFRIHSFGS